MKLLLALLALIVALVLLAASPLLASEAPPARSISTADVTYQGLTARQWAKRAVRARKDAIQQRRNSEARGRTIKRLKRELRRRHETSSLRAIALAATAYGVSESMLVRKARCETGGTFSPFAANPRSSARGLFQFLTWPHGGTWATTPFARFSVFDPYAASLAAAWMHKVGRGREWECR